MDKLTRRQIRYLCFRIQTGATGGAKAKAEKEGPMQYVDEVKKHMESQDDFGGWDKFAKTWDVDEKAYLVVVLRKSSIQSNWNRTLKEEAKEFPVKKLLTNKLSEKVQERKLEQAAEHLPGVPQAQYHLEGETPEKPEGEENKKLLENDLKTKVQERKKQSEKTNFWDKLK